MAVKGKKARFNPFVFPSDFFKSDGDPVYLVPTILQGVPKKFLVVIKISSRGPFK